MVVHDSDGVAGLRCARPCCGVFAFFPSVLAFQFVFCGCRARFCDPSLGGFSFSFFEFVLSHSPTPSFLVVFFLV